MPLVARVSLQAQKVVREAFEDLERTLTTSDRASLKDTTLQDVRKAAYIIEDQLGQQQSLRNMRRLMPLFAGLEHYLKAIEVLCNGTPYLPLIWAPIKLVLTVALEYVEAFEKTIKAYARIAEPLARFKLLNHEFLAKSQAIQETLAVFCSDILRFHKEAYQFVRRSSKFLKGIRLVQKSVGPHMAVRKKTHGIIWGFLK
ncbi:hypothetical protein MKZ38_002382 [Zalerion maritima]|uniref:DUF7708 domain-containing protein n=1 Tax=Zalerion maritima TaxID=339359 RepID=A0AAD5RYS9_9PEZI|nr:hypothetical protein MKZ38_002382 [Zalerion maritima]